MAYSRKLRDSERVWAIYEAKTLALISCLKHNRHLLISKPCHVYTDSKVVQFLRNLKSKPQANPRLTRWTLAIADMLSNIEFHHLLSHQKVLPDALSRQDFEGEAQVTEEDRAWIDESQVLSMIWQDDSDAEESEWPNPQQQKDFKQAFNSDVTIVDFVEHLRDNKTAKQKEEQEQEEEEIRC